VFAAPLPGVAAALTCAPHFAQKRPSTAAPQLGQNAILISLSQTFKSGFHVTRNPAHAVATLYYHKIARDLRVTQQPSTSERHLTGDDIISEVLRNSEAGQFRIRRTVLVPCIFHVYLHPADYDEVRPVLGVLTAEARSALIERVDQLNKRTRPSAVAKFLGLDNAEKVEFRIVDPDWTIELHPDLEDKLKRGEIEIHSDLASAPRPEFEGAMTRHVTRRQRTGTPDPELTAAVAGPRSNAEEQSYAWLSYTDAGKECTFAITKNEVVLGRGGKTVWVDVRLQAPADVSREHCRIRRDGVTGRFYLKDLSQFGTTLDGRPIPSSIERSDGSDRDVNIEVELPANATIGLAGVVTVVFQAAVPG